VFDDGTHEVVATKAGTLSVGRGLDCRLSILDFHRIIAGAKIMRFHWDFKSFALYSLLLVLTGISALLALKVRSMQEAARVSQGILSWDSSQKLREISGKTSTGERVKVTFSKTDPQTLLYVFDPNCKFCEQNRPGIKRLLKSAMSHYRVLAISTSAIKAEHLDSYGPEWSSQIPTMELDSTRSATAQQFGAVPLLLSVSGSGFPQGAIYGPIDESNWSDVTRLLGKSVSRFDSLSEIFEGGPSAPVVEGREMR
jgi:hypothetical protein